MPKGGRVLNQNGLIYTNENIDRLLFDRHISQKVRRSGGRTSGPKKRTKEDDEKFEAALRSLIGVNQEEAYIEKGASVETQIDVT